jgi:hypothetical protein
MIAYQLLTSCFVLTAYGSDLGPPPGICSAPEVLTNVYAYQTPQSTAKITVGLTGFADRPVWPDRPRNYPQVTSIPLFRLATTPRSPPLLTVPVADVQRDPNRFTDHGDPAPTTRSSHDKHVFADNLFCPPVSHDPDTSNKESFMKRLTGDGPKKDCKDTKPKPLEPGQELISILFTPKKTPKNICGYGPELFYTMTRTCTTPVYHSNIPPPPPPPPMPFFCELLYMITVSFISAVLLLSTACVFGLAKAFDKLTGVKIPCRGELLFVFLTLFPAPGSAVTQTLADQSSIQVVVHTISNASTAMADVDTVTSWAQLVTACRTSANITLSPTFKMGVYTHEIDFRLVLYTWLSELETVP